MNNQPDFKVITAITNYLPINFKCIHAKRKEPKCFSFTFILNCLLLFQKSYFFSNMVMIITVPSKQQFDMLILHLLSIVVNFLLIE